MSVYWSMIRRGAAGCLVIALAGCSTLVQLPAAPNSERVDLFSAQLGYAKVLRAHVNELGEVDFAGIRDDRSESGLAALQSYVRAIAATPLNVSPQVSANAQTRLAHMINSYNALSIYNVIASGVPQTHAGWAKVRFFVLRKFEIGGTAMSLYSFENDIIRKLDEPRVHFALNCSAVSCPLLPKVPFSADQLDESLERETRRFFADPSNLRVDHPSRTVYLSELLKFYSEDFVPKHAPTLLAYAARYAPSEIPSDYALAFTAYDWTIKAYGVSERRKK
jgi:hypothetical protein